jgi:hypothetical protein
LAKTYNAFTLAKENIELRYDRYLKSGGIKLKIRIPTELVPHPTKYTQIASLSTQQSVLVKEEILHHKFQMKNLNAVKCVKYVWNCIWWMDKFSKQGHRTPVQCATKERIHCSS